MVIGEVGPFIHCNTALQVPWKTAWMTGLETLGGLQNLPRQAPEQPDPPVNALLRRLD